MENVEIKEVKEIKKVVKKKATKKVEKVNAKQDLGKVAFMEKCNENRLRQKLPIAYSEEEINLYR